MAGFAADLELFPADAPADAGAEGLGAGLFGGKAGGEALRTAFFALAVGDLAGGEDALEEAIAKAGDRCFDAVDLRDVGADAEDHGVSIAWELLAWRGGGGLLGFRFMEQDDNAPDGELVWRDLVTLRQFTDPVEAMVARGALESAGIEAFLRDENIVRMDWFYANMVGGLRLQVAKEDVEAAETVLSQPIPESFSTDDGSLYEQPKCPRCQSLDIRFEHVDSRASLLALGTFGIPLPGRTVDAWKCHACGLLWQDDAGEPSDID